MGYVCLGQCSAHNHGTLIKLNYITFEFNRSEICDEECIPACTALIVCMVGHRNTLEFLWRHNTYKRSNHKTQMHLSFL